MLNPTLPLCQMGCLHEILCAQRRAAKLLAGQVGKQPFPPLNCLPSSLEMSKDALPWGCWYPAGCCGLVRAEGHPWSGCSLLAGQQAGPKGAQVSARESALLDLRSLSDGNSSCLVLRSASI